MPPEEVLSRISQVLSRFEEQDLSPMVIQEIADVLNCELSVFLGPTRIIKVAAIGEHLDITIEDRGAEQCLLH
jgi:hypothetical protein